MNEPLKGLAVHMGFPADTVKAATGTSSDDLQRRLLDQVSRALCYHPSLGEEELVRRGNAMLAALAGIKPQDEVEGMLAVQMVATHNVAMECLMRAALPEQTIEGRELNLRHAGKLMAMYLRQLEVLDKHRGGSHQTVTVNSVNVESGGQAVVGHVHTGQLPGREPTEAIPQQVTAPLALDSPSAGGRPRRKVRRDG
jgi:hypothetical protein